MHSTGPDPDLIRAVKAVVEGDAAALDELQTLVGEGREVNGRQDGTTLLETAVCYNNLVVAELLLNAGARFDTISRSYSFGSKSVIQGTYEYSAASDCQGPEMAALLGRYDPPYRHFDNEDFPFATGAALIPEQSLTSEDFNQISAPRFGGSNPETCDNPFFLDQIRTGFSGFRARRDFVNNSAKGIGRGPVWSFQRFGRSVTALPDGRLMLIAGEHEDGYDPDFKIYNDVTVVDRKGGVQHFLYPEEIFPPTDFHTATLMGDYILMIGSLGYTKLRHKGKTQVLRLNLNDFSVEPVVTHGDNPGWISQHHAVCKEDNILISGGVINPGNIELKDSYALNLPTMTWRQYSQPAM